MVYISSAELQGDTKKYLAMASTEQVVVRTDSDEAFELVKRRAPKKPDADYHNSLSVEEFRAEVHKIIDRIYKLPR